MKHFLVYLALTFLIGACAVICGGCSKTSSHDLSQPCKWSRCGKRTEATTFELINCEDEEKGTAFDLVRVIQGTKAGAIRWECGE